MVKVRGVRLLVMRPQTDNFNHSFRLEYLIDEPVLNIDPSGICACKIAQ
jgi:hypothetical protein